ncbi:hypothetical protein M0Q97_02320 [Candidatus Dojkabacteria bacterium]|jgi:hypothetical protein|nr:hypothetical protein [Candidatus Dojkabacteria bacterium]
MIKVDSIPVTNKTYIEYINIHKNDRISRFLKIYTFERFNEKIVLESFDKLYKNTKYEIKTNSFDKKLTNYKSNDGYQIWFKTDSENEYRIDLIPIKNFNINIESDFVWSISFTLDKYDIDDIYYERLTNLGEEKEVLIRIGDILNTVDIIKYFVIGNTLLEKKIRIYKQLLLFVFPNYNIEMSYCEGFIDNKGLYIWK